MALLTILRPPRTNCSPSRYEVAGEIARGVAKRREKRCPIRQTSDLPNDPRLGQGFL
jgi:hypothetical protein